MFLALALTIHNKQYSEESANELPEESDQFRFLRVSCFANLKGSVGLIMAKSSGRLHSEFIRLLFLQAHRETDRFFCRGDYNNRPSHVA